jgi:hypothetical protein
MTSTKRKALRRLRGYVGETVYLLCAKIDDAYDGDLGRAGAPATDTSGFSWLRATITEIPDTEDGDLAPDDEIQIKEDDGSVTYYERRFLLTYEEAVALRLPKVPAP